MALNPTTQLEIKEVERAIDDVFRSSADIMEIVGEPRPNVTYARVGTVNDDGKKSALLTLGRSKFGEIMTDWVAIEWIEESALVRRSLIMVRDCDGTVYVVDGYEPSRDYLSIDVAAGDVMGFVASRSIYGYKGPVTELNGDPSTIGEYQLSQYDMRKEHFSVATRFDKANQRAVRMSELIEQFEPRELED